MPADKHPIDVHTIIPDTLLTFEVFSNTNNKMEIYCSSGQNIREQTIEDIKRDNITELYINPHDIKVYYIVSRRNPRFDHLRSDYSNGPESKDGI